MGVCHGGGLCDRRAKEVVARTNSVVTRAVRLLGLVKGVPLITAGRSRVVVGDCRGVVAGLVDGHGNFQRRRGGGSTHVWACSGRGASIHQRKIQGLVRRLQVALVPSSIQGATIDLDNCLAARRAIFLLSIPNAVATCIAAMPRPQTKVQAPDVLTCSDQIFYNRLGHAHW